MNRGLFLIRCLALQAILILASVCPASALDLRFARYTAEDGLPQTTVYCSLQDSRGFMWFGTQDGLARFDGYEFKTFRHVSGDTTSLSNNWIWSIFEDSKGYLWIGTFGGGACRYDPARETFRSFSHDPLDSTSISNNSIWSFLEEPAGTLWIGANNGLNRFEMATERFSYWNPAPEAPNVFSVTGGKQGIIWLLTAAGPFRFDIEDQSFERFPPTSLHSFKNGILATGPDGPGLVSIGMSEISVFRYQSEELSRYTIPGRYRKEIPRPGAITVLWFDQDGSLLIGTANDGLVGVRFSDSSAADVYNARNSDRQSESLSHNRVTSIYQGRSGDLWVGTREGLNHYSTVREKFGTVRSAVEDPLSLTHSNVLPIESSRHEPSALWVGTYRGLNRIDRTAGRVEQFLHDPGDHSGIAGDHIVGLYETNDGDLWVGTWGEGITRMRRKPGGGYTYRHYRHRADDPESISSDRIYTFYQDKTGVLWVGTAGGGLNRYDAGSDGFVRYEADPGDPLSLTDPFVTTMREDRLGRFWMGTVSGGFYLFNSEEGTFNQYKHDPDDPFSISNNRVLCIEESSSGDLWIGTAAGLNRLRESGSGGGRYSFVSYREADGLPNEVVYGILEDDHGSLWVSTNRGLARITPGNEGILVRSYTRQDGLQGNEFNTNAFHRGTDGTMYFGGPNGLNFFHPDSISDNPHVPPVVFTDFRVFNEFVPIGSELLAQSISMTREIILSYNQNVFSFMFAALDFAAPNQNLYAYRMEGFDQDWVESGSRRLATYTNLDPGKYTFKVRGSNNDGVWNHEGASIALTITPPPWRSWWAYCLYALTVLAVLGLFVRLRVESKARELQARVDIEMARAEERDRMRRKSSADFHDEAGHLLTKITLFLELAKRKSKTDGELGDYLGKIEEHTKALSTGMRDFIWGLDPEKDSLHDTLVRLRDFGNQMFQPSTIRFLGRGIDQTARDVALPMDVRRSIVFIFKEAMNNCLKYSGASEVTLRTEVTNGDLVISLSDDGIGFTVSGDGDSYGLRNMRMRAEKVGGSLDIRSTEGKGTAILLRLAVPHLGDTA